MVQGEAVSLCHGGDVAGEVDVCLVYVSAGCVGGWRTCRVLFPPLLQTGTWLLMLRCLGDKVKGMYYIQYRKY